MIFDEHGFSTRHNDGHHAEPPDSPPDDYYECEEDGEEPDDPMNKIGEDE